MIQYVFDDEDSLTIAAEEQLWDRKTLKQLKDEHGITFMTSGNGVCPVIVKGDLVAIGMEDDGQIVFEKSYGQFNNSISKFWVPYLIADLEQAMKG